MRSSAPYTTVTSPKALENYAALAIEDKWVVGPSTPPFFNYDCPQSCVSTFVKIVHVGVPRQRDR